MKDVSSHNVTDGPSALKAILTDVQFWIPAAVLLVGIVLLVALH